MTGAAGPASPAQGGTFDPVLVTGGSGFVGTCAVRRLLDRGHAVQVLLRPEARTWRLRDVLEHERLTVLRADVKDASSLRDAVLRSPPRTVVHLATEGAYEHQSDASRILDVNVRGTHHLVEAALECGVRLFVNAGSSSEYGYKDRPMREDDVLEPNSTYAVAKAAQTHLVSLAARSRGLPAVTFRLFSVYGPWEEPTRLVPTLLRRARAGLPLEMVSPDTARDFVYVDDVLDALLGFEALADARGAVLNLGTGVQSTLRDVVAAVQKAAGTRSEVRWGAMAPRRWDSCTWRADPSRTAETLGWRARTTLDEGIARTARWTEEVGAAYGPEAASR